MRKIVTALFTAVLLTVSSTGLCFAAEVPANLTIPEDAKVLIDVTIGYEDPENEGTISAESILMTGTKGTPVLTVQSLTVKNNNAMGTVSIDKVESVGIKDANGDTWTLVADSTDFVNMAVDQHKFSLVADESHDMINGYEAEKAVYPESTQTIDFSGKTGPVTKAYTAMQVAKMVVTLSIV